MNTIFKSTEEMEATQSLIEQSLTKVWNSTIKPDMEQAIDAKFDCIDRDTKRVDILWELAFPVKIFGIHFSMRRVTLVFMLILIILLTSFIVL